MVAHPSGIFLKNSLRIRRHPGATHPLESTKLSVMPESKSLYARLGGYDAISAVSENLVGRLMADERLGRFWAHRGEDGLKRELQLLVNFLCNVTGGPMVYTGRDMKISHKGMGIDQKDWTAFITHVHATLDHFGVAGENREAVVSFVESTKGDIVEA